MPTRNPLVQKDIISIRSLNKSAILKVLKTAAAFKKKSYPDLLKGKVMASMFFEPSTRTRLSFESAMSRLGGKVISVAEVDTTSIQKGESLVDSARIIDSYVDVIIIRHKKEGAARLVADNAQAPVINAGDGANQHPTQTLLDLFTIKEAQGKLAGLNIALLGDLKYGRTVHSLVLALAHFPTRFYFVSPPTLALPATYLNELKRRRIKFSLHLRLEKILSKLDILYITRIQHERFPDPVEYEKVKNIYVIKAELLKRVKKNLRLLHPLPRRAEIDKSVDETPYAYYFQQAANGLYVRQALLALVLGKAPV